MSEITRPIHKVADILSRRGQTIYGREKIVELCAKTGVSLMDGFASELGDTDTDQALLDFVTSYAKMNPAAKLTVLTLSRLHEISIPKELLEKRSIFADILESFSEFTQDISDLLKDYFPDRH
ncbi:MAG: hypothetical protein JW779_11690 [Candidatus Thorarchaeota archaeon]|nr:hypothetical protein [Candidatus Thorarchaeota archaeon]